jgi:cytochrome c oxidase subunit 2
MRAGSRLSAAIPALLLAGCTGLPVGLDPAGPAAEMITGLFWWFTAICTAVWVLVVVAMGASLLRARPADDGASPLDRGSAGETSAAQVVAALVGATALILVALTILAFITGRGLAQFGGEQARTIEITGHQWWWEVRYPDGAPEKTLSTANEIHVPVGEPVRLALRSSDVIHSFWIPRIAGKQDLIPGQVNHLDFTIEKPGIYRGQCAEFCGFQHAHMGLVLVAHPRDEFERWFSSQLKPAQAPQGAEARAGQEAFLSRSCVMCHTVRGTPAGGKMAPDLTHIASRKGVAANTLPMTRGALAAWIADPQAVKPGAHMPRTELDPDELNSILAYLEQLK